MAPRLIYSGGYEGRIDVLAFEAAVSSPTLTRVASTSEAGAAPTWLSFSADGRYLCESFDKISLHFGADGQLFLSLCLARLTSWLRYTTRQDAVDEWGDPEGELHSFRISSDRQTLTKLDSVRTRGLWPCHSVLVSPKSSSSSSSSTSLKPRILCSNYQGQSILNIALNDDGTFDKEDQQVVSVKGVGELGPHEERQKQSHPHGVHVLRWSGGGETFIVVPDLGVDELRVYALDEKTGHLKPGPSVKLSPGAGPRHVLFDHARCGADTTCYVLEELSNSVSVLSVTPPSSSRWPTFTTLQTSISLLPPQSSDSSSSTSSPAAAAAAAAPAHVSARAKSDSDDFKTWHAAELHLSPSRLHLLASNRAAPHDPLNADRDGRGAGERDDLMAVFAVREQERDRESDAVEILQDRKLVTAFGRAPRHFEFEKRKEKDLRSGQLRQGDDDDGDGDDWVVIACHDSDTVVVARWNEQKEELDQVVKLERAGRPGVVMWA